jgi:phage terminase large subunit
VSADDKKALRRIYASSWDPRKIKFLDGCFPAQVDFINEASRFIVICGARRMAKSNAIARKAIIKACMTKRSSILIMAKSMSSCRSIFELDIFDDMINQLNCGIEKKLSPYHYRFPNGSMITFEGVDTQRTAGNKKLGRKHDMIILDEVQTYENIDLEVLVKRIIRPMLTDKRGTLILSGNPGDFKDYWYTVCHRQDYEIPWSMKTWSVFDNPYMAKQVKEETALFEKGNPEYKTTSHYRRSVLGEWVLEDQQLVYVYGKQNIDIDVLPKRDVEPTYVLGVDVGFNDPDAYALCCWFQDDPTFYIVETFEEGDKNVIDQAARIDEYIKKYNVTYTVIDGMMKKVTETYKGHFDLPIENAEQHGKNLHIDLFNADMARGNVKILKGARSILKHYDTAIWDTREKDKRVEDRRVHYNDVDAVLYAHTKSTHYREVVPLVDTRTLSQKRQDAFIQEHEDRMNMIVDEKPFGDGMDEFIREL